jgi:mono/diheme cytochrome c family protein
MRAALLLILVGACSDPTGGSTDGREVYHSTCTPCHGMSGKPDQAMIERLNVRDLTDPAWRNTVDAAKIEHQIRTGSANKLMPSFQGALTDAQIKAVSDYVASPSFVTQ